MGDRERRVAFANRLGIGAFDARDSDEWVREALHATIRDRVEECVLSRRRRPTFHALASKYDAAVLDGDRMKATEVLLKSLGIREGTVLRDPKFEFAICYARPKGFFKISLAYVHGTDYLALVYRNKKHTAFVPRPGLTVLRQPREGYVFSKSIRYPSNPPLTFSLRKYIEAAIAPSLTYDDPCGAYWHEATARELRAAFEERINLRRRLPR